jgi:hypothetical protein
LQLFQCFQHTVLVGFFFKTLATLFTFSTHVEAPPQFSAPPTLPKFSTHVYALHC